ncbi:hypothetical protein QJS10_CPA09g00325 [Acorus calamus]|uniref:Uncharacterized protein n=1 Tax=Acorus calamus TaxID=4465 RepID=A0AAV9E4H4_ACOCL|nr:hypothetical protein QJS10_CPA09g00325 [Acorus calamus]
MTQLSIPSLIHKPLLKPPSLLPPPTPKHSLPKRLLLSPSLPLLPQNPPRRPNPIKAIPIEDIIEKDYSFISAAESLDPPDELSDKLHRIVSAGGVDLSSAVLVSLGTEGFVDRVAAAAPPGGLVVAVHASLMVLAGVKERRDEVRCWQGELLEVPERFGPFDAVFLCFLPGMSMPLDWVLEALIGRCSEGARIVISYAQGRNIIKQQQQQFPDMVTSDLPDRSTTDKAAANHSFRVSEFVDDPTFYLAVLQYHKG